VGKDLWEMFTENNSNDRIFFHVDAILISTGMVLIMIVFTGTRKGGMV
jgi:hypothetical protein